jgi:hypothetical protein
MQPAGVRSAEAPDEAARSRETAIAKILKRNRIRRFDAAHVLDVLRRPPVQVAAGTIEAASARLATPPASVSSTVSSRTLISGSTR